MEHLSKNELYSISIYLDYTDLISLCNSNYKINRLFCKPNDPIWLYRLDQDYPDWKEFKIKFDKSLNLIYKFIHGLNILKQKLNLTYSLIDLYNRRWLDLSHNQLTKIPPEIGNLVNLQELNLSENRLKFLPLEICNLVNLIKLTLYRNRLKFLPPEIGNLVNLKRLFLNDNQLIEIPPEIGNLKNLVNLSLNNNRLTGIPSEIGNLVNLRKIWLHDNLIKIIIPANLPDLLIL